MVQFQVTHLSLCPCFVFPLPPWAILTILTVKNFLLMSNLSVLSQFKAISLFIPQTDTSATDLTQVHRDFLIFLFLGMMLHSKIKL